jgi:hypothetical protein
MPVMEIDIRGMAELPIRQEHIDFWEKQLAAYKRKTLLHPNFQSYVDELENEIESMRQEMVCHSNS